ncbi:sensor histidine kinase [Leucobacter ruminantium]|uniref:histidine kinase n=1 Tax=Leucobacter ruminantium TaxID=1289170 RepID=A0A939LSW1_9MICO|nr:sensor histidine kinase [Leucobacter ruminantium]MBO1804194.1 sensor histidine kinase [Leucobacter ruminantium]
MGAEREPMPGSRAAPGAPSWAAERPWAMAGLYLLLAAGLAVLGGAGLWDVFSLLPEHPPAWWTLATAVPACATVLLERRAPFVGLALSLLLFVADLLTVGGLVPLLVMLELIHACVISLRPRQRRRMLWASAAGAVVLSATAFALTRDPRVALMIALQFGGLLGVTFWYANSVAQSRELVELHRRRAEDAVRLAELDRIAAVQGERDRMARELHDVVAGHVAAVAIRSEAALGMPGGDSAERGSLRAVRDSSLEAHAALRSMIQVLRSGESDPSPSPGRAGIADLADAAVASGVGDVRVIDGIGFELSAPVDHAVGRVVQEALANAVRHASGAEVEVRLSEGAGEGAGEVRVDVVSRGGSALARPELRGSGMGLGLLEERAHALGGEITAGPETGGVWAVRARLPRGEGS